MLKENKAPRNRTLVISESEKDSLMQQTIRLFTRTDVESVENQLISQDLFTCIDLSTDSFIDLLIVDRSVNPNKHCCLQSLLPVSPNRT